MSKSAFIRNGNFNYENQQMDESFTSVAKPLKLQLRLPYKVYFSREMKTITGLSYYISSVLLIVFISETQPLTVL